MSGVWNIGNTTVRNPKRIEMGLRLLHEGGFLGNLEGEENEIKLTDALVQSGVVDSASKEKSSAWLGRKWRNVMVKLGFITDKAYRIEGKAVSHSKIFTEIGADMNAYSLTPAGERLVMAKTLGEVQDVFLQQLYRHQLPNPLEKKVPKDAPPMRPFVLLLDVLLSLQNDDAGISQTETAIFIQEIQSHTQDTGVKIAMKIIAYRKKRGMLSSRREKLIFDKELLSEVSTRAKVKLLTPRDYADTTIRYFSMTGLFEVHGSRMCIKAEKRNVAEELVKSSQDLFVITDPVQYLKEFYVGTGLPTDNTRVLNEELAALKEIAHELKIKTKATGEKDPNRLKAEKYKLEEDILFAKEEQFALLQQNPDQVEDIISSLSKIATSDRDFLRSLVDLPAYLEWIVWRGFLSVDHITVPTKETRGFPVDSDLQPRYPAPGGRPDMSFEFLDYSLVVEVTLTTSTRQYIAECEPVRRHVANGKGGKETLGIFIAPTLDNNFLHKVREHFRGDELIMLKILPLTISHFVRLLEVHKSTSITPDDVKDLILRVNSSESSNGLEWKKHIEQTFDEWLQEHGAVDAVRGKVVAA